ncbi:hypothetical protein SPBR_08713 [Sporothrix brasiliensis 5110]|uniref:Uncharacterized protein n=1 Tax=Sporothrix brasiliensis 5110 TaxID=1398154 RepID=A0A0C2F6P9_9PEZI|nr:uncharacterized protein SPBR_08713 [Sporothrix brasiliensis 5110]KIH86663.1 hypothetical protein SPBR_08713 [Sporothrix brasiliensis 5110]
MSHYSAERRGRSARRYDDRYDGRYGGRYDDRYDDRFDDGYHDGYHHGYDACDDYGNDYGHDRRDFTTVDRYRSQPARRSKSSHRSHRSFSASSPSPPPSSSSSSSRRSPSVGRELKHVVTSALTAGAVEAFRLRNTPGKWASGAKGGRVATAAIGAAVADTAVESNNPSGKHGRRHVVEAAMAGLLTDRLVNGKRKK